MGVIDSLNKPLMESSILTLPALTNKLMGYAHFTEIKLHREIASPYYILGKVMKLAC